MLFVWKLQYHVFIQCQTLLNAADVIGIDTWHEVRMGRANKTARDEERPLL